MNKHDNTQTTFPLFLSTLNFKSEDTKTNWGATLFNYSPDLRE